MRSTLRTLLGRVGTLMAAALLVLAACVRVGAARPPNVVLIVADDLGYADLGVHGSPDLRTPNIDALAANGVRFTNAYVSAPQCSPSRAGLLTGRYQQRFGHEFNLSETSRHLGLPLGEVTLADRMRKAGYATGVIGKWHLGAEPQFQPGKRGFDEFFGFLPGAHAYLPGDHEPIFRGTTPVDEPSYLTDAFGREASAFIAAHATEPFFLYLAFNAVHAPVAVERERLAEFAAIPDSPRRTYAAGLFAMDQAIGRVLATLRTTHLLDDTLVVFLSDNGAFTMSVTANGASNLPLRGSKRTTLEGGIRVPLFMQWPARLPAGRVVARPVVQLDVVPTVLAAAGVTAEPGWKLDGVDLLPYTAKGRRATTAPHAALFWRFGPQMAIRRGAWKLVRYDLAVEGRAGTSAAKLYDLRRDVGEANDVAALRPRRVRALQRAWDRWNAANVTPLWRPAGSE